MEAELSLQLVPLSEEGFLACMYTSPQRSEVVVKCGLKLLCTGLADKCIYIMDAFLYPDSVKSKMCLGTIRWRT